MKTRETQPRRSLHWLVRWLAVNVAFISWHKHWKGLYLHCVHPRYCVRLYLWGCDWHKKAKYALEKPSNNELNNKETSK
jgi:hypothetical protein